MALLPTYQTHHSNQGLPLQVYPMLSFHCCCVLKMPWSSSRTPVPLTVLVPIQVSHCYGFSLVCDVPVMCCTRTRTSSTTFDSVPVYPVLQCTQCTSVPSAPVNPVYHCTHCTSVPLYPVQCSVWCDFPRCITLSRLVCCISDLRNHFQLCATLFSMSDIFTKCTNWRCQCIDLLLPLEASPKMNNHAKSMNQLLMQRIEPTSQLKIYRCL